MKIAVVKYDSGNIKSVFNAVKYLGEEVELVSDPEELDGYDLIILPGVGAFSPAITSLIEKGFYEKLNQIYQSGNKVILGICLGMQLMCKASHENGVNKGFGWIDAEVVPLRQFSDHEKVPHIGWNNISINNEYYSFDKFTNKDFYFVHSYCVKVNNKKHSIATTKYCTEFSSIVANGCVIGVQFHPEKSQKLGLELIRSILDWSRKFMSSTLSGVEHA